MVLAVPDRREVIRHVAGKEELMRRRETGQRTELGLGNQGTVPDGQVAILGLGDGSLALKFPLGIHPREPRLARGTNRQAGVVEDRPGVFLV